MRVSEGSSGRSIGATSDVHEKHAAVSVWAVWSTSLLQQLCMQRCRSDRERGRRRPARSDPQASARQQRQLRMQTPIQTESRRRPLQLRCADRFVHERFPSAENRTCTPRKNGRVSRQRQTQRESRGRGTGTEPRLRERIRRRVTRCMRNSYSARRLLLC